MPTTRNKAQATVDRAKREARAKKESKIKEKLHKSIRKRLVGGFDDEDYILQRCADNLDEDLIKKEKGLAKKIEDWKKEIYDEELATYQELQETWPE